jgi:hypothetical protein
MSLTRSGSPLPPHEQAEQPPMREHKFKPNPACFAGHIYNVKKKEKRNADGTQNAQPGSRQSGNQA